MEQELERLRRENEALRLQISQLIAELARLNDRVAELLAIAQRKQRKPASPTAAVPPAPPAVVGDEAKRAFGECQKICVNGKVVVGS